MDKKYLALAFTSSVVVYAIATKSGVQISPTGGIKFTPAEQREADIYEKKISFYTKILDNLTKYGLQLAISGAGLFTVIYKTRNRRPVREPKAPLNRM